MRQITTRATHKMSLMTSLAKVVGYVTMISVLLKGLYGSSRAEMHLEMFIAE